MKTDTIKSLFTGRPLPYGAIPPQDKGYWELLSEFHQRSEKLMHRLSAEDREELGSMQDQRQEATQYEIEEAFIQGYSLGVRLTAEAFLLDHDQE